MRRPLRSAVFVSVAAAVGAIPSPGHACTVTGENVTFGVGGDFDRDVVIRPPGEDPFRVTSLVAERLAATIPSRPQDRTKIEVHGSIGFSATTGELTYVVGRQVETSAGMVKLYRGATLSRASALGDEVVASVNIRGGAETVESVHVPCDALTLKIRLASSPDHLTSGDGTWWRPAGNSRRFTLRAKPEKAAPALVLVVRDPVGDRDGLSFQRLAVEGNWTQVAREGFKVVATGWAPTSTLRRLENRPDTGGGWAGSVEGPGYAGHGRSTKTWSYEGPAHLAVGATIFARPGRGPWATVEKDGVFEVHYNDGDPFAQVTSVQGVRGPELPAYVPIAAVKRDPVLPSAGERDR